MNALSGDGPLDNNKINVLRLFFNGPGTVLHIREVARRTGLTPRGAQNILESLKNNGLLNNRSNDIVNNYWGDYNNEIFIGLKRSLNLYSLYSTGLISMLEDFYRTPKCIVLFGSYAKGEDTEQSDIDIAVITNMKDMPDVSKFDELLDRKISIQLITNIKKESPGFMNSMVNGIVLYGYLDVI
jgi:predicted nucleotidyltransferase